MPTEKPRFTVIMDEDMLRQVDDFRFGNRYASRSAAAIELIRLGLETLGTDGEGEAVAPPDKV